MALVAFFVARYIVSESRRGDSAVLPDPQQLTILISLLSGSGLGPLKDTMLYKWLKKERLVSPLPAAFWALLLITLVGYVHVCHIDLHIIHETSYWSPNADTL